MPDDGGAVLVNCGATGAGLMVRLKSLVENALSLPVTLTVKVAVPVALGVPVMAPAVLRLKPLGRLPDEIIQVYGVVPPLADRDWE